MSRKPMLVALVGAFVLAGWLPASVAHADEPAVTPDAAAACTVDAQHLCLQGGRFRVSATYSTPQGQSGNATLVSISADTGYAWFFNSANVELIVKVLNGCGVNSKFWVFAGGLTNVRVDLTVVDTNNGAQRVYTNPQSTAFAPIQDTSAFSCP
jgi:hypothetical protein